MATIKRLPLLKHGVERLLIGNKKAQLTPRLARDSVATWRLSLKLDTAAAIEGLTCASNHPAKALELRK